MSRLTRRQAVMGGVFSLLIQFRVDFDVQIDQRVAVRIRFFIALKKFEVDFPKDSVTLGIFLESEDYSTQTVF